MNKAENNAPGAFHIPANTKADGRPREPKRGGIGSRFEGAGAAGDKLSRRVLRRNAIRAASSIESAIAAEHLRIADIRADARNSHAARRARARDIAKRPASHPYGVSAGMRKAASIAATCAKIDSVNATLAGAVLAANPTT